MQQQFFKDIIKADLIFILNFPPRCPESQAIQTTRSPNTVRIA
jgi:hypothetical protein